ncbi:N-acetyltransferase family protein [Jiella sp. M17.18]|uniref:GNAT family N-acetyltransferase n=1 Tax=Jiella sp. M17.18 TaxID=3234247 RepID=UPI0034DE054A
MTPEPASAFPIRAARPQDVPGIATIWYEGWREAHLGHVPEALMRHRTWETFQRRSGERLEDVLVAEADGAVAGFVRLHHDEAEQVFVAPAFRGTSGVTGALMDAAEALLARRGVDNAFLVVNEANARARRFYEKRGWRFAAKVDYPVETEDGEMVIPILRYEKALHAPKTVS